MGKLDELLILLLIILLLFGAKKVPELARSIGQSVHEVKKGLSGGGDDNASDKSKS